MRSESVKAKPQPNEGRCGGELSGARAQDQGGEDAIAGLRELVVGVFLLHRAVMQRSASCARDMRRVSFPGARGEATIETVC